MSSIRDRILDAVIAALSATGGPAGLNVVEDRTHSADLSQLPMIGVFSEDDDPEGVGQDVRAPLVEKSMTLTLEYRAAVPVPETGHQPVAPRKVIDPLYCWAMAQVAKDETFGGLAMWVKEGAMKWLSKEGDTIVAAAAQKLTVFYQTKRLDPTSQN
jgi:hypothetical protein